MRRIGLRRLGSLSCGLLGVAITAWAALQPWHEANTAPSTQIRAESRSEFVVTSPSQTEIRRMAQRMLMH
jgi:hypothetical protein